MIFMLFSLNYILLNLKTLIHFILKWEYKWFPDLFPDFMMKLQLKA